MRKARLHQRITTAQALFALLDDSVPAAALAKPPPAAAKARNYGRTTLIEAVLEAIKAMPTGQTTIKEVREALEKGPFAARLKESDKGFYNAFGRLAARGAIVREGPWVFTRDAYSNTSRPWREAKPPNLHRLREQGLRWAVRS